jgi:hypothetical protein
MSNNEIIRYNLQDLVYSLHEKKLTPKEISEEIFIKEKIRIKPFTIYNFLKPSIKQQQQKYLEIKDKNLELAVMNYREELYEILSEVKEMKQRAKEEENHQIYEKLIGRLYQGIELLAKLTGDFKDTKQIDINVIVTEVGKHVSERNKHAKPQNIIDVEAEIFEDDDRISARIRDEEQ